MVNRNIDGKEVEEFKKIWNQYFDKRKQIMKTTEIRVEDIFGFIIGKESIPPKQIIRLNSFLSQNDVNMNN